MFVVYKITNLKNNKCYIGSSIRVEKRWQEHKRDSQNSNNPKYNYPLYQAFREDGIDNFKFEIIADDFDSVWDMEEYEQQMIDKYDCLKPKGYNQTRATHSNNILSENHQKHIQKISCKCAKVDINENIIEIYKSYHEAARKNNHNGDKEATHVRAVCKGDISSCFNNIIFRDLDENNKVISKPMKRHHGKKAIIGININNPEEELYFESISAAAEALNTDRKSLSQCIQGIDRYSNVKGYIWREIDIYGNIIETNKTIEDRIFEYNEKNPLINGERHNITEWCDIFNISTNCFYKRKKKGMDSVTALTNPKRR
jgi:group I intron endonuclease